MSDLRLRIANSDRPETDVRPLHTATAALNSSLASKPAPGPSRPEERNRTPDEKVQISNRTHLDENLVELGNRFEGLIRVLDDIRQVSEGLPEFDVDSMTKPVLGVLKGVMGRIMNAPATTVVDLGIKAQVVMWANQDWWEEDAQPNWQMVATRALVEQTIAAAGLTLPLLS